MIGYEITNSRGFIELDSIYIDIIYHILMISIYNFIVL